MKSNLEFWKELQDNNYFENHKRYNGIKHFGDETLKNINKFINVNEETKVVIIGCGYGREIIQLAPYVKHIYGIDVNETILSKADKFLKVYEVENCSLILAEEWKDKIPTEINLIYSMAVMQHLTRDLVYDYFFHLNKKLKKDGEMIIQFLEKSTNFQRDAELKAYEPSVSWRIEEIKKLADVCGLYLTSIQSIKMTENANWHWGFFRKVEL